MTQPQGWTGERLAALLPALWRVRDAAPTGGSSPESAGGAPGGGGALAGLLAVLAEVADAVARDLETLRDDWTIETASDWAVAYIGDLLATTPMHDAGGLVDPRPWVAETLALRRRKGTLAAIEATARAVTGYPTVAVETDRLLAWNQHLAAVRDRAVATVDLRDGDALDHVDGAFDRAPRIVDVRSIGARARRGPAGTDGDGHHNLPTVTLHAWQLATRRLTMATLRPVTDPPDGRYEIHPLGLDLALRRIARVEGDVEDLATERDVPSVLRRRTLHALLVARRQAVADGDPAPADELATDPPFLVRWRGAPGDPLVAVPPERVACCNLADPAAPLPAGWRRPPTAVDVVPSGGGAPVALPIDVAVDPALGRVAFPEGTAVDHVEIDHADGHVAALGGGAYARDDDLAGTLDRDVDWQVAVSVHEPPAPDTSFVTLADAVDAWHAQPDGTVGMITITDSHRYDGGLVGAERIRVGPGSRLVVVGAGWPELPVPGGLPGETARRVGVVDASGVRPVIVGDLDVTGAAGGPDDVPGELVLHGLWIDGRVRVVAVAGGDLGGLALRHVTVTGGVRVTSANDRLGLDLARAVAGSLEAGAPLRGVAAADSVVTGALDAEGSPVTLDRVTVLGEVRAVTLDASDCLLVEPVEVARRQTGCVRYSWVAPGSTTPRRFSCQPDLALAPLEAADADASTRDALVARLRPAFVSEVVGDARLGLLTTGTADALRRASSTAGEPGAHAHLHRPHREDNLRRALDEHLPLGLEAGLIDPGRHLR